MASFLIRRHWSRFSLRAMFAFVSLLAISLAWLSTELMFVRQRTAWRNENDSNWPAQHYFGWKYHRSIPEPVSWWRHHVDDQDAKIPKWREWMGDAPVTGLYFGPQLSDEECERLYHLFPEAIYVGRTVRSKKELFLYEYKLGGPLGEPVGSFELK